VEGEEREGQVRWERIETLAFDRIWGEGSGRGEGIYFGQVAGSGRIGITDLFVRFRFDFASPFSARRERFILAVSRVIGGGQEGS
jgi:hypothetical protein